MNEKAAHVIFELEIQNDWPPVGAERVWARPLGKDLYVLENVPWFAPGVGEGDTVRAVAEDGDKWPVVTEIVEWAGNYTIRFIPLGNTNEQDILDAFAPLGGTGEAMGGRPIYLVALSFSEEVDIAAVKRLILDGKAGGRWEYEEACIDQLWAQTPPQGIMM